MGWEGPVTHRQVILWIAFHNLEMNRPSRSDFYTMRVAFEVFWSQRKYPNNIDLEPFRLSFGTSKPTKPSIDKHAASAQFKAKWFMTLGLSKYDIDGAEMTEPIDAGLSLPEEDVP